MPYPSVEPFLVTWFNTLGIEGRPCAELPANLTPPVVQFTRIGGADPNLTLDEATVSVDCYGETRGAAYDLAEKVRAALRTGCGYSASGAVLARVRTLSAPSARPYDNTSLRRVGATYLITVHAAI